MFRNSYQRGMLTVFYSAGANPFKIWEPHVKNGHITRSLDEDIRSMTCDIRGTNVSTTYIMCPKGNAVLGISMPFLVMIVKNLKKYFTFEVTILDDTGTRRRFRISNFQSTTQILPLCTVMPIGLSDGWNQIQFNLAEFTRRAYKKQFVEVQKLKINANIRLRRVYFAERLIPEDELPAEYKLYFPISGKRVQPKRYGAAKENEDVKPNEQPVLTEKILEMIKAPSVHSVQKKSSVTYGKDETTLEKERSLVVTSATATPVGQQEEVKGEATPQPESDHNETGDKEAATKDQATTIDAETEPMTEEKAVQVDASNNDSVEAAPVSEDQDGVAEAAEPPPAENVAEDAELPE